jgi:hypothetical protein
MRVWLAVLLVVFGVTSVRAQEPPQPAELQKMYDDALAQLKAAQDRKNELGIENESLKSRIAELEKQVADTRTAVGMLEAQVAENADKTFFYRSYHAAWQVFLHEYPYLMAQWKYFLENGLLSVPHQVPDFMDSDWPFSAEG